VHVHPVCAVWLPHAGVLSVHTTAAPSRTPQESLTQPLRVGFGLGVSSASCEEPFLAASLSKKVSLAEGETTQLSAKARLELDPRTHKARHGHVRHMSLHPLPMLLPHTT
jgi:hypothetical protein